jgi:hypothetical protein
VKEKRRAAMNYIVFQRRIDKAMLVSAPLVAIFGVESSVRLERLASEAQEHYKAKRYEQAEQSLFALERYANNQRV